MNQIDEALRQASEQTRQVVSRRSGPPPSVLRRRLRRRRATGVVAGAVVTVMAVGAVAMFIQPQSPDPAGAMTFAEYEAAYEDMVECLRSEGYTVHGPLLYGRDKDAGLSIGFGGPRDKPGHDPRIQLSHETAGVNSQAAFDSHSEECRASANLDSIEERWVEQETAKAVTMETWVNNLLSCLEANGVVPPEDFDIDAIFAGAAPSVIGPSDQHWPLVDPSQEWFRTEAINGIENGCTPWEG